MPILKSNIKQVIPHLRGNYTNDPSSDEHYLIKAMTRQKAMYFIEENADANNIKIAGPYTFEIGGEKAFVKHFGYVEIAGEQYSLIDFLDSYFSQKRSVLVRHVMKFLKLQKPEGGLR